MNKFLVTLFVIALTGPAMAADEPAATPSQDESAQKVAAQAPSTSSDEKKGAEAPAEPKTPEAVAE